jgi:hypothetical protein
MLNQTRAEVEQAFKTCAGKLGTLPPEFKKWKTMLWYREKWGFVQKWIVSENIAESHFAFDYLHSLGLWLEPDRTIRTGHNLLCIQAAVSIIEAVLFDLLTLEIRDSDLNKEISRTPVDRVRQILCKKGLLTSEWSQKIGDLHGMRNLIHLAKGRRTKYQALNGYNISDLEKVLDDFNCFIRTKY